MKKFYIILIITSTLSFSTKATTTLFFGDGGVSKVVRFYPNPSSSVINFEFKNLDKTYNFQVYSFLGKRMIDIAISSEKMTFSLDAYYRGLYIYKVIDKMGNIVDSGKFQVIK